LKNPVTAAERETDPHGSCRRIINERLKEYEILFDEIDDLVVLAVPGVEKIREWRRLQEEKLRKETGNGMTPKEVDRFVDYYIPSTIRYVFPLRNDPRRASLVFLVGQNHNIVGVYGPGAEQI
ncbi:MAG: kinase, partial [Thermotogae bacterium]